MHLSRTRGNPLTAHHFSTILPSPAPAKTCLGLKEVWCDFTALDTVGEMISTSLGGERKKLFVLWRHQTWLEKSLFYSKVHPMRSHEYSMISPLPSSNQTWLSGNYTIQDSLILLLKPQFPVENSQLATFDETRGYNIVVGSFIPP